jgi:plasmid stability protein
MRTFTMHDVDTSAVRVRAAVHGRAAANPRLTLAG